MFNAKCLLILTLLLTSTCFYGCSETTNPVVEEPAAAFVSAVPASGSKIATRGVIILTFSSDPGEVTVAVGTVTGTGKTRQVSGPFAEGALTLAVHWTNGDGSTSLNYTVIGADDTAPIVEEPVVEEPVVEEPKPELKPPPDLKDLGVCKIGMVVKPGESCSYMANGEKITFWVHPDGLGCRSGRIPEREEIIFGIRVKIKVGNLNTCSDSVIEKDDAFQTSFSAEPNDDKSWTILDVP